MVVKPFDDDAGSHPKDAPFVGLLERLESAYEASPFDSESAWSEAAGCTRQQATTLRARLMKNPDAQVELRTAAALAKAAQVSLSWLATGEGPMMVADEVTIEGLRALIREQTATLAARDERIRELELRVMSLEQAPARARPRR